MANGIDWFRWHHGSVTDPKFQVVAKKAGVRLGDVMVVWAFLLEKASADDDRGSIDKIDFETLDFLVGGDDGDAVKILDALTGRGLIDGSRIVNWEKRQPKRERDDDSADRVAKHRAKKRQDELSNATVTPSNATQRQETPRGEESREEKNKPSSVVESADNSPSTTTAGRVCARLRQSGVASVNPSNPKLIALLAAGLTEDELADLAAEPSSKGKGFAWLLAAAEGRRRDAAQTGALPQARASPGSRPMNGRQSAISNYAVQAATARGEGNAAATGANERDITGEAARVA